MNALGALVLVGAAIALHVASTTVSKPRSAKQPHLPTSSGVPGTFRSNAGFEAIEEPMPEQQVPFFGPPGACLLPQEELGVALLGPVLLDP